MINLALPLVTGLLLAGQPASPLPDAARNLPSTWPPPGWGTRVVLPGEATNTTTAKPVDTQPAELDKWVEVFPHVRINRAQKTVEFDGKVPWDFHDPDSPRTELELLVCLPLRDKEHESLVMSEARGAHVHAALLMVGLQPGTPGAIDFGEGKDDKITRREPVGPFVTVRFVYTKDGQERIDEPKSWVIDEAENQESAKLKAAGNWHEENGRQVRRTVDSMTPFPPASYTYVFGGSKVGPMRNEQGDKVDVYFADMTGALIGLCTFGSETIGITRVLSPDSGVDVPNFTANNAVIPPIGTPIRVRITPSPTHPAKEGVEKEEKSFPGLNDTLRAR